jgi:hypothetical protein
MQTYILIVRQIVEVGVTSGGRAAAISVLESHPPMRILPGTGFYIKTRDDIEILENDDAVREMPGLRATDVIRE